MPDHEARGRAVYDHDNEEPRPAGRRRRQVADWGVGEELFDGMPGRRFERRPHQEIPRGEVGDGRRTIVIETGDEPAVELPPGADEEFASRDEALRARERHDELWRGDEPFADESAPADEAAPVESWAAGDEPFGDERSREVAVEDRWAAADAWAAEHESALEDEVVEDDVDARADGIVRGGVAGRRTVKIGGRPAEFHGTPARARRRPPRTVHERLGPRPERIAAWAFVLGLLLILIAVATANAATI
jgi:hypothetical protein